MQLSQKQTTCNRHESLWVELFRKLARIESLLDIRNLRRCEGNYGIPSIVPQIDVEVVKITTGCPHNDDFLDHSGYLALLRPKRAFAGHRNYLGCP